jgi:hypothetical protein
MRFSTALDNAGDWFESVSLYAQLGEGPVADVWLSHGSVDDLEFAPLLTSGDIWAEAAFMKNCVRTVEA